MRVLINYIEERVTQIEAMLTSLTANPIMSTITVKELCDGYLDTCSEIENAMIEIVKRFGDMRLDECVTRFGHIEGEISAND